MYIYIYINIHKGKKHLCLRKSLNYRANSGSALGQARNKNNIFIAIRSSVFTFLNFHPLLTFLN